VSLQNLFADTLALRFFVETEEGWAIGLRFCDLPHEKTADPMVGSAVHVESIQWQISY
jgi:hypothetical protein